MSEHVLPELPAELKTSFLERLERLCALPSVAAAGRAQAETAREVMRQLGELGLDTELHETAGAPVVFAEKRVPGRPTVLFYNHYDVQPPEPLELWESDPFILTERDGRLYARGVSDDKGELVSRMAALEWVRERHGGELPFGVVFVVEGEEEVGSPNMETYVREHAERLQADACVWEFGGTDAEGRPELTCGLKGIVALDLHVRTADHDQHSGRGPLIQNAVWLLAAAVASLRDKDGHVLVQGFHDDVQPLSDMQEHYLRSAPAEEEALLRSTGAEALLGGAAGYEFQRRAQAMPVINVNGLHGGYGGPGTKTVLPAEAHAKLDIRLVPEQDPADIVRLVREHLDRHGFGAVEIREAEIPGHPARVDPSHPWIQHAADALEEAYGQPAVIKISSGGSGPLRPFTATLGLPVVMMGIGNADGRAHAPNENIRWQDVHAGTFALVRALERWSGA